jgi:hypothetical protein
MPPSGWRARVLSAPGWSRCTQAHALLVAVDEVGRKLAEKTVAATSAGHAEAVMWARERFTRDLGVLADPAANLAVIVKDGVVVKNAF